MLHRLVQAAGLVALIAAVPACGALEAASEATSRGTYDYATLEVPLGVTPAGSVAVTVIDERPYVVNGEESAAYVGRMPGRYRNTVDVETASGRPLAAVVADAIVEAYRRQGVTATAVPVPEEGGLPAALSAAAATGAERVLVVRIGEWQTHSLLRVEESWQLEATVHDPSGEMLGRRASQGKANAGATGFDEETGEMAVSALSRRLTYLLNDPKITRAMGGA